MRRRSYFSVSPPSDVTLEEARAMPSYFRIMRVNEPDYRCEACSECRREPWVNGYACDEHTREVVALAQGAGWREHEAAVLAAQVLRAGGNPEARYSSGIGAAQWNYKTPRRKADREATVLALTTTAPATVAA